jgi:hypothetical protein
MNVLDVIKTFVKADMAEVVYQVQKKDKTITPAEVIAAVKKLEEDGLVEVEILVSAK